MPEHPLDGPRLRIKWARKRLDELDGVIELYKATEPYRLQKEIQAEQGIAIWKLIALYPPFLDGGPLAGEMVGHLRAALDHLYWQLALIRNPNLRVLDDRIGFPVFHRRDTKSMHELKGRLRQLPDEAAREVKALQPYQAGDWATDPAPVRAHPLWVLNTLAIIDKHHATNRLGVRLTIPQPQPRGIRVQSFSGRSINDGDVIAAADIAVAAADERLQPRLGYQVFLDVPEWRSGEILDDLRAVHDHVRDMVLPRFERFFS